MEAKKSFELVYRGKKRIIEYEYLFTGSLAYVEIYDKDGKSHRFYKGMYGDNKWTGGPDNWPSDFVDGLHRIFDTLQPVYRKPEVSTYKNK